MLALGGLFSNIDNGDTHHNTHVPALAITHAHDWRIPVPLLKIIHLFRLKMTCARINGKILGIDTPQAIRESLTIGTGR